MPSRFRYVSLYFAPSSIGSVKLMAMQAVYKCPVAEATDGAYLRLLATCLKSPYFFILIIYLHS
jgi:ABC-type multidrug transport system permease subunit